MKEGKTPRKLKINIEELASAMEDASYEHSYYLDLETGRILFVTEETHTQLEEIYEEAPDEETDNNKFDLKSSLKKLDLPDWQKEALREAEEIEKGFGSRYISIPRADSSEAYGDIEDFIATARSQRLQNQLYQAIRGSHPFRRFKDVLASNSAERERWFNFQESRLRERALEWLEDEGVELDISSESK